MEFIVNKDKLQEIAKQFWLQFQGKNVFAFHGNLGAGKTTFIQALCIEKKSKDLVSSPSFSIINEYDYLEEGLLKTIFHIDLYRLKNEDEIIKAGVEECFFANQICFVEWPERAPGLLPEGTIHVFIEIIDEQTRLIRINEI